jgi:hypothetical protein
VASTSGHCLIRYETKGENTVAENAKDKVKVEDLPVPLKDLNAEEEEEVKGGINVSNPNPVAPNLNPISIKKPNADQY